MVCRVPGLPPCSVIQSCCSTQSLRGFLSYQHTGYHKITDRSTVRACGVTVSTSSTSKKLQSPNNYISPRSVCVCGPGYSSHVVGRCPHPSCLCWLTQFRSDTPLTCDTSLHISINTHLAQLQLNNNTHHYLATVFPQDCPCLTDHCILRTLP